MMTVACKKYHCKFMLLTMDLHVLDHLCEDYARFGNTAFLDAAHINLFHNISKRFYLACLMGWQPDWRKFPEAMKPARQKMTAKRSIMIACKLFSVKKSRLGTLVHLAWSFQNCGRITSLNGNQRLVAPPLKVRRYLRPWLLGHYRDGLSTAVQFVLFQCLQRSSVEGQVSQKRTQISPWYL